MEIIDTARHDLTPRAQHGRYAAIYRALTEELPIGTTVHLEPGTDYDGDPKKLVSAIRTGLWNRGWRTSARITDDGVYLRIPGPTAAALKEQEDHPA